MSAPIIAFFNNKGGVGKTSLVYHLTWMFSDLGVRVLAADLDPQANLTAAFLDEDRLSELWPEDGGSRPTIFGCVDPLVQGTGDVGDAQLQLIGERIGLVVGDLKLATFEDEFGKGVVRVFRRSTTGL
jgi:chromosome partitioning protein